MTLRRATKTRDWVLICNSCWGNKRFPGSTAFHALVRWIGLNGWQARNVRDAWEHTCSTCREARLDRIVDRERLHS